MGGLLIHVLVTYRITILGILLELIRIDRLRWLFLLNRHGLKKQNANETLELLRPVAYFFAFLYFFLTLSHFFLLQETFKWTLFTSALLTATVSLVIGLKASNIPLPRHSLIILLLMLMASSNSLLHLCFSEAPEQTTNIFFTIIATGIVLSDRHHWAASVLFKWIGWLTITITIEMALTQHFSSLWS
jgi:hypothetical protein